jgi:cation diffusion facilitator family transporter
MKYSACEKCARSVGKVNVIGNMLMILIKGYLGVVGGSKGLIADAIHSCADLLATILMIIGLRVSGQEKDERYPYGYGKAEYLVAVVIYMFLFVVGLYVLIDGIRAIAEACPITPRLIAAWGAIVSIAINELMFRQTVCVGAQTSSPSITAKAWESRSDVYSSIAVLAGILGAKMGFHFMDPLAAIAVGVIILRICFQMVKESIFKLMDMAPERVLNEVRQALATVKNIAGIKDVNAREVGREMEFEIALHVLEHITVSQGEKIKREAKRAVRKTVERKSTVKVRLFPVSSEA